MTVTEEWKGWPGDVHGLIEVSTLGNVRTWRKRGRVPANTKDSLPRPFAWNSTHGGPYLRTDTRIDGRRVTLYAHVMVLETFVGARPVGMVAAHRNNKHHDNRLTNLRWATQKENVADMVAAGRGWWQ